MNRDLFPAILSARVLATVDLLAFFKEASEFFANTTKTIRESGLIK